MRRMLILHALLGTGHQSAARALETAFAQLPGAEASVEDSLDFINPTRSSFWKSAYKGLSEPDLLARMAAGAARVGRPQAAGAIVEQIMHDLAQA